MGVTLSRYFLFHSYIGKAGGLGIVTLSRDFLFHSYIGKAGGLGIVI